MRLPMVVDNTSSSSSRPYPHHLDTLQWNQDHTVNTQVLIRGLLLVIVPVL